MAPDTVETITSSSGEGGGSVSSSQEQKSLDLLSDLTAILSASIYTALSLQYYATYWGDKLAPSIVESLLACVKAVGPGSVEHLNVALDLYQRVNLAGSAVPAELKQQAQSCLEEAMRCRYGPISPASMQQLIGMGLQLKETSE